MQKGLIKLKNPPCIAASAAVCGKRESEGPLGRLFDFHDCSDRFGMPTWEQSEGEMQRLALNLALSKAKLADSDIDAIFAGDLINQCTSSAYGLLSFDIPFFGLYGACSTSAEALILAALTVDGGFYGRTAAVTSSHNCSAERQFRFPIEYGGQRTPTAQWTVTAAGAFILDGSSKRGPFITEVMPGRTVEKGITDANNMGAAMAPAAVDTLSRYFRQSGTKPADTGLIVTGDLGFEGHAIVRELMAADGLPMPDSYTDCGLLIYDRERQDMHAGGSGCGCSASVLSAHLLGRLHPNKGDIRSLLYVATGALMSPMSVQQGQSIPGVAHLVRIESEVKN